MDNWTVGRMEDWTAGHWPIIKAAPSVLYVLTFYIDIADCDSIRVSV